MSGKYVIVGYFKYKEKIISIIYNKIAKIVTFVGGESKSTKFNKLTADEYMYAKSIFDRIKINKEYSEFMYEDTINNNKYNIFHDREKAIYFWESADGIERTEDNIILNFKYNYMPTIVNKLAIPKINLPNKYGDFFSRLVTPNKFKKPIAVMISSMFLLSQLSGCQVTEAVQSDNNKEPKSSTMIGVIYIHDDPYGNTYDDPYGNTYDDSYGNTYDDSYGNTYDDSYGNTYDARAPFTEQDWEEFERRLDENKNLFNDEKVYIKKAKKPLMKYGYGINKGLVFHRIDGLNIKYEKNSMELGDNKTALASYAITAKKL